jgi:hypothetical protein
MSDLILDDYEKFVKSKRRSEIATGHTPGDLNEHLFDFQHAIVSWAVRRGRAKQLSLRSWLEIESNADPQNVRLEKL